MTTFRTSRSTRTLVLATALTAAIAGPVAAQFGGDAGLANAFRQDFYRRDLLIFNEVLDLEDWQRPIIEVLLDDYAASFEAGLAGMRDEISKIRVDLGGDDGSRIMERMMGPLSAWEREKVVLRDQFLANVQTQLGPGQIERWPALERAIRREKELPQSELSGEGIDLVMVVQRLDLPGTVEDDIAPAIASYENELDAALVSRTRRVEELQPAVRAAMQSMDFERGLQVMQQIMAARIEVRNAQDRGMESIAAAMPQEQATLFLQEAWEIAYPKVYGPNPTIAFIEAAKAIADLTPEQVEGIAAIERDYLAQLDVLNARLRELYRTEEPREPQRRFERILQRQRGETPSRELAGDPKSIRDVRGDREELGRRTREAILALLTPEQTSNLPGFAKPGDLRKNLDGGFQDTPSVNTSGLGSRAIGEADRRREALSPKDHSPKLGDGAKSAESDRVLQAPSPRRGGRSSSPSGSSSGSNRID
jgi:hypothetical protein